MQCLFLTEYKNSLKYCTASYYTNNQCAGKHSTYYINVKNNDSAANLTIFPNFYVFGDGVLHLPLFSNFYSLQLDNARDISVYIPWSLIENPIKREVTILVQLDGDAEAVSYFVKQGGFDSSVLSGVAPESILIGIGTAVNGTGCPSTLSGCSQRLYEFSDVACNRDGNLESGYCPWVNQTYGGLDLFLDFTWNTVIPSVLERIGFSQGEVGIFGESLGGYAACYASAKRPTQFQRALCMSPSFWWNYGSFAAEITRSYSHSNATIPKAVVMTLGTQESPQIYVPANYPATVNKKVTWEQFVAQVTDAFLHIGMGQSPSSGAIFPSVVESNLVSINYIGGEHNSMQWGDVFSLGLSLLYRSQYPDSTRLQRSQAVVWNYPTAAVINVSSNSSFSSSCSCPDYPYSFIVTLSVLLAITSICLGLSVALWA